jgi:hypothetical protein
MLELSNCSRCGHISISLQETCCNSCIFEIRNPPKNNELADMDARILEMTRSLENMLRLMIIDNQIIELQANERASVDKRIQKQIEELIFEKEAIMKFSSE